MKMTENHRNKIKDSLHSIHEWRGPGSMKIQYFHGLFVYFSGSCKYNLHCR